MSRGRNLFVVACVFAALSSAAIAREINISLPEKLFTVYALSISELSFADDYPIVGIVDPMWEATSGLNWPACYRMGSRLNMTAKLAIAPALPEPTEITIKATGPDNLVAERVATISGANTTQSGLITSGTLPNRIQVTSVDVEWKFLPPTATSELLAGWSGPHTIYTTLAAPISSADVTDLKLNYSVAWAANSIDAYEAAEGLTDQMHTNLGPWQAEYDATLPSYGPCKARATVLKKALGIVGADSVVDFAGEFTDGQCHWFYWWAAPGQESTATTNYEAFVRIGNMGYDPTLNRIGTIEEMTREGGLIIARYSHWGPCTP